MKRFAASIEYYGTNYSGWQKQKQTLDTVQEKVENALSSIANEEIKVICSGRTDAGVHAISQVIHFDTNAKRFKKSWVEGTNSLFNSSSFFKVLVSFLAGLVLNTHKKTKNRTKPKSK